MTEKDIARQLFECAAEAGNSEHKRAYLIRLPEIVLGLAADIAAGRYQPQRFTVFAVTDPKLREIFAPAFPDRLVQQWLVRHIEPWFDKRFIDDSYANRKGKGTHAAVTKLQQFMRQPKHRWYCKLDIQAFFPNIDRRILLNFWQEAQPKLPFKHEVLTLINQVATTIINQSPVNPPPRLSGDRALLAKIPPHKSLYHAPHGIGLPIGSLTSQFFANVYLNELDQYIKHTLKIQGYLRYVDDFIILGDNAELLIAQQKQIAQFLQDKLHLQLHPHKIVLQRVNQGADYLGSIVYPHHSLIRQRSVRALHRRLYFFRQLLASNGQTKTRALPNGTWQRWLNNHTAFITPGVPTPELLQRMLATINSYYGLFIHARTYTLRKHIYHRRLGTLQTYFLPANKDYTHLRVRKIWINT